jgi:hypothetical protein
VTGSKVTAIVQNTGGNNWKASIYRNGTYYDLISDTNVGFSLSGHNYNGFEHYSWNSTPIVMPSSHFDEAYLYHGGSWHTWDNNYFYTTTREYNTPYIIDLMRNYYDFYVHSPIDYLPIILKQ